MEFVESTVFTRRIATLLSDEEYQELQAVLTRSPRLGDVIPGTGGLRKIRWRSVGRGKSGGVRVIYEVWAEHTLHMVFVYGKSVQDNLTAEQLRAIRERIHGGEL